MNRKWLSALMALILVLALAAPVDAAQTDGIHMLSYSVDYESDDSGFLTCVLVGMGISAVICFGLVSLQRNVHKQSGASEYITEEGVNFTHASDRYTHTTRTRRKLENNQNNRK